MKPCSGVAVGCAPQPQPDRGMALKQGRGLQGINVWKVDISGYV